MKQTLLNCRTEVCKALGITEQLCELSMGMSGDFEQAVSMHDSFLVCYFIYFAVLGSNIKLVLHAQSLDLSHNWSMPITACAGLAYDF